MQGDPEETAFRAEVDREIEHRPLEDAVDDPLDAAGVLLDREDVVRAEEGDARRRDQVADDGSDPEPRVQHGRASLGRGSPREEHDDRAESRKQDGSKTS
jgi:hypothetical protein